MAAALYGGISVRNGCIEQSNFHAFPALRIPEMPTIEVHLLPGQRDQGGIGEPGVPPMAPAVSNAIFAATGKRVRKLPSNRKFLPA